MLTPKIKFLCIYCSYRHSNSLTSCIHLLTDSAIYIQEELKLVQAELSSLEEVCSKIEHELQLVESLEGL